MIKNILLIVLYKKDIYTSSSVQSFLNSNPGNTGLIIWDNSPEPVQIEQISILRDRLPSSQYTHTPNNLPLSVIYNKVIESNKDKDLIYLFDDDSLFCQDYFKMNEVAYIDNKDIALFAPIISANDKIVSPGYFKSYKTYYHKQVNPGRMLSKNTLVITSGVSIAVKRITNLRFDENLNLYGIDLLFSYEYSDVFKYLYVVNYTLIHDISIFSNNKKDQIKKMQMYKRSALYIYKKRGLLLAYIFISTYWNIKLVMLRLWRIKD